MRQKDNTIYRSGTNIHAKRERTFEILSNSWNTFLLLYKQIKNIPIPGRIGLMHIMYVYGRNILTWSCAIICSSDTKITRKSFHSEHPSWLWKMEYATKRIFEYRILVLGLFTQLISMNAWKFISQLHTFFTWAMHIHTSLLTSPIRGLHCWGAFSNALDKYLPDGEHNMHKVSTLFNVTLAAPHLVDFN